MPPRFCHGFVPSTPSLPACSGRSLRIARQPCGKHLPTPAPSRRCFLPRFSMSDHGGGGDVSIPDHGSADASVGDIGHADHDATAHAAEHNTDAAGEDGTELRAKRDDEDWEEEAGVSDGAPSMVQGPAQAPTKAGVSTEGMPEGDAAFITACYDADVGAIEAALDKGQDVNVTDVNRRSALHFCAGNGLPTLCTRLLDMGADIDGRDVLGLTPLHMATGYKKVDTVVLLVERGADANIASMSGELAVEIAERMFEKTPEKKFFLKNDDHARLKEIVEILDEATEEEEEVADEGDEGVGEEVVQEEGSSKFVVRVKPKGETKAERPVDPPASDVKVTIRVKEPKK